MTDPTPLRHYWLLAISKTLRYLLDYADKSTEATAGSLQIFTAGPKPKEDKDG